jgi:CMP-N-acetylneuraminic acid synthetase
LKNFWLSIPAKDSLFSVTRLQTRLYDQHGRAINHDPSVLLQTQDLPPVYEENSCLYLFTRQNLLKRHHRIGAIPSCSKSTLPKPGTSMKNSISRSPIFDAA